MAQKLAPSRQVLEEIIKSIPTPFHLYDEAGIRRQARKLKDAFAWNKGYREFFAVKALPNPAILKILMEEGCGLDCSSMTELMLSERVGAKSGDIMFSSNATPDEEFVYARRLGAYINLDDITLIDSLEKSAGVPEEILCRYNPGGTLTVGNHVMGNPEEAKYGFTRPQLTQGFKMLMEKGAKRFGLHAFLASNVTDNRYYPAMARTLFETARQLQDETGAQFFMINLSGGIGIPYRPEEAECDIRAIGEGVEKAFREIMAPAGMGGAVIATELGRYMTGPFGYLVARATHEKHIYRDYIALDACAADLMRPAMYGAYHHITVPGKENQPLDHVYDVVGSLCENNDKFAVQRPLPRIDMGDLVVIHDTGAHGHSMGYNYNGKLRHAEVLLHEDGSFRMIRRAETAEDYFATLDF